MTMTTTTTKAAAVVDGGSSSAAVIKAGSELSREDLRDALTLAGYSWTVQTRYLSNGRIKAWFAESAPKGSKTVAYDHGMQPAENHLAAAMAFLNGLDNGCTEYKLVAVFSSSSGYVFTFR